jgi:hypothetical protein
VVHQLALVGAFGLNGLEEVVVIGSSTRLYLVSIASSFAVNHLEMDYEVVLLAVVDLQALVLVIYLVFDVAHLSLVAVIVARSFGLVFGTYCSMLLLFVASYGHLVAVKVEFIQSQNLIVALGMIARESCWS